LLTSTYSATLEREDLVDERWYLIGIEGLKNIGRRMTIGPTSASASSSGLASFGRSPDSTGARKSTSTARRS
jgi:hypothetical protein